MDISLDPHNTLRRHVLGSRPKPRATEHTGDAYRHMSHYKPHMCICLQLCCQDEEYGCRCKDCPCRGGKITHDQAHELHAIEREKEATRARAQEAIYTQNSAQEIHQAHIGTGNR